MTTNTQTTTSKPVQTFRSGSVEAAIWLNQNDNGARFYSLTVARSYATEDEGTKRWKRTQSFGSRDLLDLRRVVTSAEAFIAEQPL